MDDGGSWIEIILLAMLAGFIGLRLVSVLGRRTGHERPVGEPYRPGTAEVLTPGPRLADARARGPIELPADTEASLAPELERLAEADGNFDPVRFVGGAKAAYAMILEAFWKGDTASLAGLMSDEVHDQFASAVATRREQGLVIENRLVRVNRARLTGAQMIGQMAEVTVQFDADIVVVTRDAQGQIVAGSTSDAVPTSDVWTFSRLVGSQDPNWLLIATDDASFP
jgi:predicted lipid-binding transport protein (Tim44 family)